MYKLLTGYKKEQVEATQFIKNVKIGKDVVICPFVNLYDCEIGDDVFIGPFVEIQAGSRIGSGSRIQSHAFVCSYVAIGNNVFIGHGVVFINDKYPKANKVWIPMETTVGNNTSIGSNSTIFPVRIGEDVMIGAGSVLTKDISNGETWVGNPAKRIKRQDTILQFNKTIS